MSKYLYLYRGPATPREEYSDLEAEQELKAWAEWMSKAGHAVIDQGNPLAGRASVCDDGTETEPSQLYGDTVVEAETLEEAKSLLDGHPFLSEGQGRFTVEIFEILPVPA
ncbi:YciI family protein [Kribbella sp. NPDC004536]|uniref:YciI family protein n=1 Tax=Kribbella sp. NPDC004536 TaxID=3364106 RepID=UPI00367ABA56